MLIADNAHIHPKQLDVLAAETECLDIIVSVHYILGNTAQ